MDGTLPLIIFASAGMMLSSIYTLSYVRLAPSPLRSMYKTGSVALLGVAALLGGAPWLLVVALFASAVGDYALSRDEAPGQTAVLLLDLDHFKEFNDRWGHDVGDRALKAVAEVIRHKASDHCGLAARIGGEEFVILVRAFDVAEAMNLAEEIRLGIERIEIRIDSVRDSVTCSASIGVAVHEGHDAPELKILLKRADDALYEAKRDGRNRFKLAA